jgi:hypothetical protein
VAARPRPQPVHVVARGALWQGWTGGLPGQICPFPGAIPASRLHYGSLGPAFRNEKLPVHLKGATFPPPGGPAGRIRHLVPPSRHEAHHRQPVPTLPAPGRNEDRASGSRRRPGARSSGPRFLSACAPRACAVAGMLRECSLPTLVSHGEPIKTCPHLATARGRRRALSTLGTQGLGTEGQAAALSPASRTAPPGWPNMPAVPLRE